MDAVSVSFEIRVAQNNLPITTRDIVFVLKQISAKQASVFIGKHVKTPGESWKIRLPTKISHHEHPPSQGAAYRRQMEKSLPQILSNINDFKRRHFIVSEYFQSSSKATVISVTCLWPMKLRNLKDLIAWCIFYDL